MHKGEIRYIYGLEDTETQRSSKLLKWI